MPGPHPKVGDRLEKLLQVEKFPPPADFAARTRVSDPGVYEQAAADPEAWWATQARERLHWETPFSKVLDDSNPPFYTCLLYTSPSPRDGLLSRMPSSA